MRVSIVKLKKLVNAESQIQGVQEGSGYHGTFKVPDEKDDAWEIPKEFKPRIGKCILVDGVLDYIRTSLIKTYYIHENDNLGPDKIVLPKDFPMEECPYISFEKLKKGDMILVTLNSLYYVHPL